MNKTEILMISLRFNKRVWTLIGKFNSPFLTYKTLQCKALGKVFAFFKTNILSF